MVTRRYSKFLPFFFLFADLTCFNVSFAIANYRRVESFVFMEEGYPGIQLVLNIIWIMIFFSARLHKINREFRLLDYLNQVLTGLVVALSVVFALWFVTQPDYSRQHLFITYFSFTILIITWRVLWYVLVQYFRARGYNFKKILVVGYNETAVNLTSYFARNPGYGYRFLGYFDNRRDQSSEIVGNVEEAMDFALEKKVDVIFCFLPTLEEQQIKSLVDFAENNLIKIKIMSQFSSLENTNLTIQKYGNISIINVSAIPLDSVTNQIIKRAFDLIFSSLVIIFLFSWLVPILGILIKIESKGPIFFRQDRNGRENRPFKCLKFRTMIVNDMADLKQATKNDPRITKIGSVMRKTSIDELPQFINVFKGDMSVVGPRPHRIKLNNEFRERIDRFNQRHAVKPGITGLAQAKGYRGETSKFSAMSGRVKLDRFYVKNWTLILDFKIIMLTIVSILKGSENAG